MRAVGMKPCYPSQALFRIARSLRANWSSSRADRSSKTSFALFLRFRAAEEARAKANEGRKELYEGKEKRAANAEAFAAQGHSQVESARKRRSASVRRSVLFIIRRRRRFTLRRSRRTSGIR